MLGSRGIDAVFWLGQGRDLVRGEIAVPGVDVRNADADLHGLHGMGAVHATGLVDETDIGMIC